MELEIFQKTQILLTDNLCELTLNFDVGKNNKIWQFRFEKINYYLIINIWNILYQQLSRCRGKPIEVGFSL